MYSGLHAYMVIDTENNYCNPAEHVPRVKDLIVIEYLYYKHQYSETLMTLYYMLTCT